MSTPIRRLALLGFGPTFNNSVAGPFCIPAGKTPASSPLRRNPQSFSLIWRAAGAVVDINAIRCVIGAHQGHDALRQIISLAGESRGYRLSTEWTHLLGGLCRNLNIRPAAKVEIHDLLTGRREWLARLT